MGGSSTRWRLAAVSTDEMETQTTDSNGRAAEQALAEQALAQASSSFPPQGVVVQKVDMNLCLSPKDGYQVMVDKGVANANSSVFKIMTSSTLGGFYVAMGGMLSLAVAGNIPGVASSNPGFVKWIFAALFPVNLLMALLTGAQLFTGNTANMP